MGRGWLRGRRGEGWGGVYISYGLDGGEEKGVGCILSWRWRYVDCTGHGMKTWAVYLSWRWDAQAEWAVH